MLYPPDAEVLEVDQNSLYLDLVQHLRGFAPLPLISDEKLDGLGKAHRKGTHHSCRVVRFNLIDGVAIVSLQQSVLDRPYMRYSDISVGDIVEGVVDRHGDFGMLVALTSSIRGLCPKTHISDARLRLPKRKFSEGSKVKCRILNVEPDERRLLLTCKKSLLQSTQEPLSEYSQAVPGSIHLGVISAVRQSGCVVHFYGNVCGFVTRSELSSTQFVSEPTSVFWPGQTLPCRVLQCDPAERRLLLSFRTDGSLPAAAVGEEASLSPGGFVECEVTGVTSSGLSLRCVATGELVFLPVAHLSDYPPFCPHLLARHQRQLEKAVKEGE